jgi:nucleotide-binding universal stress UspA family protein
MKKILVAYDGSKQSEKAFDLALDMASKYSARMIVLSVARIPEPPFAVEVGDILHNAEEYYEGRFRAMKDKASDAGINTRFLVRIGHPAEQIVLLANEEAVDAIVIGHRGESFLQRWLLGSVAKRVLSYANCTVVVVR